MRVYFFTKEKTAAYIITLAVVMGILSFANIYLNRAGMVISMKEPIYQGNSGQKAVAITVNVDWGEEFIPGMLEEFDKFDCKVTFFITGQWAEKNTELLNQMKDKGHSIQNHGYKHAHFAALSAEEAKAQIKKAEEIIKQVSGVKTRYFAPPYGEQNQRLVTAVSEMDYELIMWSVDTIDWQRPSPDTIVKRVSNKVHNDAIILMHPTDPTLKALPDLLGYLKDNRYQMLTIDRILQMDNGQS